MERTFKSSRVVQSSNWRINMIEKIKEACDDLPDIVKAVLFVSVIALFWDFIL